ncbi:hypothetical protein IEC97_08995 [Neobacillus cucumis]|nr:hypothetical protein [Neobacillus cucumis]
MPNVIRIAQLIAPWFSIVFLPKKSFNQYLPVSLFASCLVIGMCALAAPFRWWEVKGGIRFKIFNDLTFIFGPFIVGTLWIFHFTFGNLKRFFIVNLIIDALFSFPVNYLFQRLNLYKLVKFKPTYIFLSFIGFSFIIYGFQLVNKRAFLK